MGKKKLQFRLSEREIDRAGKELDRYQADLEKKCELLRQRFAERIARYAQTGMAAAGVDDLLMGGTRPAEVRVWVEEGSSHSMVIASGRDAVFVEFGAGVYHNGAAGSSPHPQGAALGFTIGSYGENGKKTVWGYYDEAHELHLTHGTAARMPLYHAVQRACNEFQSIAKEVFG